MLSSHFTLFIKLANPNRRGISKFVCIDEFINDFEKLKLGNGGSWCRRESKLCKEFKVITIKSDGKINYLWNVDTDEQNKIIREINSNDNIIKSKQIGNPIKYIRLCGYNYSDEYIFKQIPEDVKTYFSRNVKCRCVVCGSGSSVELDHKNGLYNKKDLTVDDFQYLCRHCNQQKRQTIKKMKQTGKRYSALKIPSVAIFGTDFTSGDESYDPNDQNWGIGTYWHDPVDFMEKCKQKLIIN